MADLKQFSDGETVTAIYENYKKRGDAELPRTYIGGSVIGSECDRQLWYGFRWASNIAIDGQTYRLFQTGHLEEPRLIKDLRDIGAVVYERDPSTGRQFAYSDIYGHFRGNLDGRAIKIPGGGKKPHVLEFKTHNDKSFALLQKHGVEHSKPMHYAQVQVYMGWDKSERALYLAKNKDTEELYAERIPFDPTFFARMQARAEKIIFAGAPPPRLTNDPAFFICKMCNHADVCHGAKVARLTCRTCVHATPTKIGDGSWHCERYKIHPTHEQQYMGCASHLPLPVLIQYAEPEDAGEDWILFRHKSTGKQFVVGNIPPPELGHLPIYSSEEISAASGEVITDEFVDHLKTTFGATLK